MAARQDRQAARAQDFAGLLDLGLLATKGSVNEAPRMRRIGLALAGVALLATTGLARADSVTYFRTDTPEFLASARLGKQMFTTYQCLKCHVVDPNKPLGPDVNAPNLALAKDRLDPDWILKWLIDPQSLQPGTKMPNFFSFNEDDDYNPIYSDADAHMQYRIVVALRDYLMILGTDLEKQLDR